MTEKHADVIVERPSGLIKIYFLKEAWQYCKNFRMENASSRPLDWKYFNAVFNTLGLGLEPTLRYFQAASPTFEAFEKWILQQGQVSQEMIDHFNAIIDQQGTAAYEPKEQEFTPADIEHWEREGYNSYICDPSCRLCRNCSTDL